MNNDPSWAVAESPMRQPRSYPSVSCWSRALLALRPRGVVPIALAGRVLARCVLAGCVLAGPWPAQAAEPVLQKLANAEIDWTEGAVVATGSGAPDPKLDNVARIRLEAERSAQVNGRKHVLDALASIRVTYDAAGRQRLADPAVRAQVEGSVKGCKVQDSRYYSDGGVDVVLRCLLRGGLATALAPSGERTPLPDGGDPAYTGLVIDASGVRVDPILIPTLVADKEVILGPKMLSAEALRTQGGVLYVRTLADATAHPRVGAQPLIVNVTGVDRRRGWRVDDREARSLRGADRGFIRDGKIVVVLAQR